MAKPLETPTEQAVFTANALNRDSVQQIIDHFKMSKKWLSPEEKRTVSCAIIHLNEILSWQD